MNLSYFDYRKQIYRSVLERITAMQKLAKSNLLRKNEQDAAYKVLDALYNLKQELQIVKHKNFDKEVSNSELEFNVTFNPFTKTANIVTKSGKTLHSIEHTISDLDYWWSFKIDKKVYDIHFHYDEYFTVCIYPVIDGQVDTLKQFKVRLVIVLKEKSF